MTYRQLREQMKSWDDDQLDCDLTIYDSDEDEYYGNVTLEYAEVDSGVLDDFHPYFVLNR